MLADDLDVGASILEEARTARRHDSDAPRNTGNHVYAVGTASPVVCVVCLAWAWGIPSQ